MRRRQSTNEPAARSCRQVIEQDVAIFVSHPRAPADHLVDFTIPLGAREALLPDDILIMAGDACVLECGGCVMLLVARLHLRAVSDNSATTFTPTRGMTFQP